MLNALKLDRNEPDLALVHRLDKVTSGLLLIGRNHPATSCLSQQFQAKTVSKYYLAVACGKPIKKQGAIIGDMEKARRGAWKLIRQTHNPAITQFFSQAHSQGKRWYLLKPSTGKTHQLRVALKSLACPILGDCLYGGSESERVHLHAYSLSFDWLGERRGYVVPPRQDAAFAEEIPTEWQQPDLLDWPKIPA